ncbi:MAG: aquaporin family protein [Bacteroidetes bacterium]|nr:aquaporin family protein [Bacteroidota bacterium]
MTPFTAEFLGTAILILLGNGVVANVVLTGTKGNGSGWIVITTAWALAVFAGVVVSAPYSGAHLNPAVTFALAISGKFQWIQVPTYILAQMLGAMLGSSIVWLKYKDHFAITEDKGLKLAAFCTGPAIRNKLSNLISEIIGSFVLLFVMFYFTNAEIVNTKTPVGLGSLGAIPVMFLIWAIGLSRGGTTGYAINPVRDLGPRIKYAILPVAGKGNGDWSYAWIPVLGPMIGAAFAAWFYLALN